MSRRALTRATIAFSILGLVLVAVPLLGSLRPTVKADASLPRIDISQLKPGQPELRKHPLHEDLHGGFTWSVLLLRHADGKISAWDVPTNDGKVDMPDIHWWRPLYACEKFELTAVSSDDTAHFHCTDSEAPSDDWRAAWQWNEFGEAIGHSVDDMQATIGTVDGHYFVVGKRR